MKIIKTIAIKTALLCFVFLSLNSSVVSEEEKIDAVINQIQIISKDLKTLENAVYKSSNVINKTSSNSLNEDVMTKHLLKLNEIEEQFRDLTNRFEEVNFKLDKLSNRVTKIQSDSQLRFSDLESSNMSNTKNKNKKIKKKS